MVERTSGSRVATFGSHCGCCEPPHLFGLWVLAELDGLGAACILHAVRLWWKVEDLMRQKVLLWGAMGCAVLLKESSALMMLSSLFALGVWHVQRGQSPKRALKDFGILALIWVIWAWELIGGGRASTVGEVHGVCVFRSSFLPHGSICTSSPFQEHCFYWGFYWIKNGEIRLCEAWLCWFL